MALDLTRPAAGYRSAPSRTLGPTRSVTLRRTRPRAVVNPRDAFLRQVQGKKLSGPLAQITDNAAAGIPGRSILGQIQDTITGAPKGLALFAKGAATDAVGPLRIAYDMSRGDLPVSAFWSSEGDPGHKYFPTASAMFESGERTAGRLAQLGPVEVRSVGGQKIQTYGDLARSPNGLVNGILEDVGNISLAGGVVSKALGAGARAAEAANAPRFAAALGTGARRAEGVARLGGEVANAPFKPYQMAARQGRSIVGRVGNTGERAFRLANMDLPAEQMRLLSEDTRVADPNASVFRRAGQEAKALAEHTLRNIADKPGREKMAERGSLFLTPTGKRLKEHIVEGRINPARFGRHETQRLVAVSKVADRSGMAPSLVEQEAAQAIMNGAGRADFEASKRFGKDISLAAATPIGGVRPQHTRTPEGQTLVHGYYDGTLPADQVERINNVMAAEHESNARQAEKAFTNYSGLGALDEAYRGDAPLEQQMQIHLAEAGISPEDLQAINDLRASDPMGAPVPWEQVAAAFDGMPEADIIRQVLQDPQVYPTAWREAMHVTGSVAKWGEDNGIPHGLPRTPAEMLAAGWERPTYSASPVIRSVAEEVRGSKGNVATTEGFGSGVRAMGSTRNRATLGTGPYSLATFAEGLNRGLREREFNHSLLGFVLADETKTIANLLDEDPRLQGAALSPEDLHLAENLTDQGAPVADPIAKLRAIAVNRVEKRNVFGEMDPHTIVTATNEELGRLLHDEVLARKHDTLEGDRNNPQEGDFDVNPQKGWDAKKTNPDTVVLPAGLKERATRYSTGKDRNDLLSGLAAVNRKFKELVLGYSLRWQVGDAVGIQLMSWVGGGIRPDRLISSMRGLKDLTPEAKNAMFNRADFVESGMRLQDINRSFDPAQMAVERPKFGHGGVRAANFRLNQVINSSGRHAFVLAKVDKILKQHGLDSVNEMGGNETAWQNPKVQGAINEAVNSANKVFGTIDDMSPFEQRIVKEIIPFWAWTRHITTLAMRTAVDNPARILWTMRLGSLGVDPNSTDPEWLRGAFNITRGPGFLQGRWSPNFLNPINDVGTGNLVSPEALMRQVSPAIKIPVAALLNRDMNRNLNTITHRKGTAPSPFVSALYQGLKATPFTRSAMDLAPTAEIGGIGLGPHTRYGSGQTVLDPNTGEPAVTNSRIRPLLIGVPLPIPESSAPTTRPQSLGNKGGLRRTGSLGRKVSLRRNG